MAKLNWRSIRYSKNAIFMTFTSNSNAWMKHTIAHEVCVYVVLKAFISLLIHQIRFLVFSFRLNSLSYTILHHFNMKLRNNHETILFFGSNYTKYMCILCAYLLSILNVNRWRNYFISYCIKYFCLYYMISFIVKWHHSTYIMCSNIKLNFDWTSY